MAFGTVLYTITLAFLLLSMTKERGELRHKTAALVDPLTGLANRRAFLADAEEFMSRARRSAASRLTVMLADLDRFKAINDRFGHAVGDRVLADLRRYHPADAARERSSGRLGGEEFAFLLPGTDAADAERIAERIRAHFAEAARRLTATRSRRPSASASPPHPRRPYNSPIWSAAADRALYRAKADGRNRVALVDCDAADDGAPSIVPDVPVTRTVAQRRLTRYNSIFNRER